MQISIRPGGHAYNNFPAFPEAKIISPLQHYNSIFINIYLKAGHTRTDSTLLTKPAQGKMDWHLHMLQLLAWKSSQEEKMQDLSYEQQDTLYITNIEIQC